MDRVRIDLSPVSLLIPSRRLTLEDSCHRDNSVRVFQRENRKAVGENEKSNFICYIDCLQLHANCPSKDST